MKGRFINVSYSYHYHHHHIVNGVGGNVTGAYAACSAKYLNMVLNGHRKHKAY